MKTFPDSRWFLCLALMLILSSPVPALDPSKKVTQYMYDNWGVEEGLPQLTVSAITQTRDGYLWIGTAEGLLRFNGVRFQVFGKRNVEQLSTNVINTLHQDRSGNLWIGTQGGGLTRMKDGKFKTYTTRDGLADNAVYAVLEDRGRNLWVGTNGGLSCRPSNDARSRFRNYTTREKLTGNQVRTIYEDPHGILWIGTVAGLNRFDPTNGTFISYTIKDGLSHNYIWPILEDRSGNLWIGTFGGGLNRLRNGEFTAYTTKDGLSNDIISAIHEDKEGNLWIGTGGGGLHRLKDGKFTPYTINGRLSDDWIMSIYEDREESLWFGTDGNGLNRLKDGAFTPYTTAEGLTHNSIGCIYQDRTGDLWIGTYGGGLSRYDPRSGTVVPYATAKGLTNHQVSTLHQAPNGTLWVGTHGGLFRLEPGNGKFTPYTTNDGLSDNFILSIHVDRRGNLWIGTRNGGLNHLDTRPGNGTFTVYTAKKGPANDKVWVIYEGRDRELWLGTDDGLNRLDLKEKDRKFITYTTEDGLSGNVIRAIHEDSRGTLWIGTIGGGLNRLEDGTFKSITLKDGLFDDVVYRVLEDDIGNLWMSCNKGIFKAAKKELNDFCDGKRNRVYCDFFDEADGMKSRECNQGSPAGWKSRDGKLWFPTIKGLVMVDPGNIKKNRLPPPVYIEKIIADDRTIELPSAGTGERPVFSPGNKRFEIHYTGLSFPVPKRVRFKTKLQGFEDRWRDGDAGRTTHYTNLSPGTYTFRVKACNNDGLWNETGASVSFYLKPWFHQTTWFYLLCTLALVLVVYTVSRFFWLKSHARDLRLLVDRRTRGLLKAKDEAEQARDQVLQAKEMADIANRAKSEFLANISHEILTPMNAILGFTQILEREITHKQHRRHLSSISVSGRNLLHLINDILDLSRLESGNMELNYEPVDPRFLVNDIKHIFTTKVMEKELHFQLDIDSRLPHALRLDSLRVRQVLFNLVGNAVKFTGAGFVRLAAEKNDDTGDSPHDDDGTPDRTGIVFLVEDSGQGIPAERLESVFEAFAHSDHRLSGKYGGGGLGLSVTHRLVKMMGGEISIQSEEEKGTLVRVTLPDVEVLNPPPEEPKPNMEPQIPLLQTPPPKTPAADPPRLRRATILVVDNMELNRMLLSDYLEDQEVEIIEAENGKKALEMVEAHLPHLILMDLKMPVMDGLEATRRLKEDQRFKHIPVIFITAHTMKEQQIEMKKVGADTFLAKPVKRSDLVMELTRFLPIADRQAVELLESPAPTPTLEDPKKTLNETISSGNRAKLHQLLEILQSHDVTHRWESLRETLILDEMEDFANQMLELGRTYGSGVLTQWAQRLLRHLETFDLPQIQAALSSFPGTSDKIEFPGGGK